MTGQVSGYTKGAHPRGLGAVGVGVVEPPVVVVVESPSTIVLLVVVVVVMVLLVVVVDSGSVVEVPAGSVVVGVVSVVGVVVGVEV
ncbi:MAG: hypothetical protein WED83_00450, partial [Acidimicrobiia bacterium]